MKRLHPTPRNVVRHIPGPAQYRASFWLPAAVHLLLAACSAPRIEELSSSSATDRPLERPVMRIPLAGPAASPAAELSGLAWYGDTLILLPQYPSGKDSSGPGRLYGIPRAEILAFLDHRTTTPITPGEIPFDASALEASISGFQGYEAITFDGDRVYLSIEAESDGMKGWLLSGTIARDLSGLTIDPSDFRVLEPAGDIPNAAYEALVHVDGRMLALYEGNGARVNPRPTAQAFNLELTPMSPVPFPVLEYRVTDATAPDAANRFWVMNYSFPGTARAYKPADDGLATRFGLGATHAKSKAVERIVEVEYGAEGIRLTETPPIQLELLADGGARNWEGIARLEDRGFLVVTDKFPETILGFVAAGDKEDAPSPPHR